jgi:S1-C subfamily serine protease
MSAVAADLAQIARIADVLGGIPVWEVFAGSDAAHAGVRFGDIIVSVNGTATPTFEAFLQAGAAHRPHLEFRVFRSGALLSLSRGGHADA